MLYFHKLQCRLITSLILAESQNHSWLEENTSSVRESHTSEQTFILRLSYSLLHQYISKPHHPLSQHIKHNYVPIEFGYSKTSVLLHLLFNQFFAKLNITRTKVCMCVSVSSHACVEESARNRISTGSKPWLYSRIIRGNFKIPVCNSFNPNLIRISGVRQASVLSKTPQVIQMCSQCCKSSSSLSHLI